MVRQRQPGRARRQPSTFEALPQRAELGLGHANELDVEIDDVSKFTFTEDDFYPVTTDVTDNGKAANRWDGAYSQFVNPSHATNPSTQVGNLWYNETSQTHRIEADDAIHNVVGAEALTTSDDLVINTVSKTYFADTKTIAADGVAVGSCYEFWMFGKLTTDATITYQWTLDLGSVVVVDTGAQTQTAFTGGWNLHGFFTVRSIGASGTVQGNGEFAYPRGGGKEIYTGGTSTVDTTGSLTVRASVQMSSATLTKTCTLQQFIVKKVS